MADKKRKLSKAEAARLRSEILGAIVQGAFSEPGQTTLTGREGYSDLFPTILSGIADPMEPGVAQRAIIPSGLSRRTRPILTGRVR